LISANDTTILAVLSRYPDMPIEEAEGYISKIEHKPNIEICNAIIGKIRKEDLEDESRLIFEEYNRWSKSKTRRIKQEQWSNRRRQKETYLSLKMNELHKKGIISDEIMILYGISGELPEINMYEEMSFEEKQSIWEEKMEDRFGPEWRQRFNNNFINYKLLLKRKKEYTKNEWFFSSF